MSEAKITLIGLYNYDHHIFDDMTLPEGIDRNLFIHNLLIKDGEFEVLYPDPEFMSHAISVWSYKWYRTFTEWLRGTKCEWNPIHNYDRIEDIKDVVDRNYGHTNTPDYTSERTADLEDKRTADLEEKRTADLEDKRTADLEDKLTHNTTTTTSQTTDGVDEHQVSAYDSSTYQAASKDTHNMGVTEAEVTGDETNNTTGTDTMNHTGTDTVNTTGTDTMNHTGTDTTVVSGTTEDVTGSEYGITTHTAHVYGNIGVTQAGEMLKNFYDISAWSLYDHMADVFTQELLIAVY